MPIDTPKDYSKQSGWWVTTIGEMPQASILPSRTMPGGWESKIFEKEYAWDLIRHVQGWKLHINVMPLESETLFNLLSPLLLRFQIYHKFLPFDVAWNHNTGKEAFQAISRTNNQGEGKNCTIYTEDPEHLVAIVELIDSEVIAYRHKVASYAHSQGRRDPQVLMPFPGGTKGNLPVGRCGLVSTRYGGFTNTGRRRRIYNNKDDRYEPDRAYSYAYPSFIELPAVIREISQGL